MFGEANTQMCIVLPDSVRDPNTLSAGPFRAGALREHGLRGHRGSERRWIRTGERCRKEAQGQIGPGWGWSQDPSLRLSTLREPLGFASPYSELGHGCLLTGDGYAAGWPARLLQFWLELGCQFHS